MLLRFAIVVSTLAAALVAPRLLQAQDPRSLRGEIEGDHPGVPWVSVERLGQWMALPEGQRPVLLDVRRQDEFAVSHLRGAVRVDPDRPNIGSLRLPAGAPVVVYCSVGYRSADIGRQLQAAGHRQVWNLLGGLFQWANEGRSLFQGSRPARTVHQYDAEWGRYLLTRYREPL